MALPVIKIAVVEYHAVVRNVFQPQNRPDKYYNVAAAQR